MRYAPHRPLRSAEAGFTLIELVAVLAIIAAAAYLALPSAGRTQKSLTARTAALDLAATMKSVRAAAIRAGTDKRLTIDLNRRRYWGDSQAKARPLPRGLTVSYEVPLAEQSGEGLAHVRFRPDGSSSGGRIRLEGSRQSASVAVDWLTGTTRVEWRR